MKFRIALPYGTGEVRSWLFEPIISVVGMIFSLATGPGTVRRFQAILGHQTEITSSYLVFPDSYQADRPWCYWLSHLPLPSPVGSFSAGFTSTASSKINVRTQARRMRLIAFAILSGLLQRASSLFLSMLCSWSDVTQEVHTTKMPSQYLMPLAAACTTTPSLLTRCT